MRRGWIVLVCVAGLGAAGAGYHLQWRLSETPSSFEAAAFSYPVTLDGVQAGSPERLRYLIESHPPGSSLEVVDAAGRSRRFETVLRQGPASLVVTGLGGTIFLAVAIAFFASRHRRPGVAGFFWVTFLYGLSIMVGGVYFPRAVPARTAFFDLLQLACLAALPVIFLRLSLAYPRRSTLLDRRRWLIPSLWAAVIVLVGWQAVVFGRYFSAPGLAREAALGPAQAVADLFMIAVTVVGVVVFAARGRRLELTRERNQVRWLLWGFTIGIAPYLFLRTLPSLVGLPALMPPYVDRLVELAIPLGFVLAVVRDQFLDIDVIIRRSLLYGLLAGALLAVYLVAGILFGRWFGDVPGLAPWVLPIVIGLGAGIAFQPLRRALGGWIDRTFFKLAHDHDRSLDRLDAGLATLGDSGQVAAMVRERVAGALLPELAAVVLRDGADFHVNGDLPAGWGDFVLSAADGRHGLLAASPRSTSLPELEGEDLPLDLLEEGFVLLQPVPGGEAAAGAILLGRRRTGRRYLEQDLDFLASSARVAGRHLQRIELMQTVAAETLARRRLAELDRLKSEFLAQVAHDLRTPVSGIAWSARNLLDGLAGDLNPEQTRYLDSIRGSGAHLGRLVDNLLEISRLENARNQVQVGDISAIDAWREALANLTPLAAAKEVTLELEGDEHARPVRGNVDKLTEVAVNLLDNAVKYTGPRSAVTVTVHPVGGGFQAISVRDRGPGLRGQDPAALFGRFAQGEPSPNSSRKGFGLGLHIAATYLDLMGGSLEATDHPEGGAVFTCRLPLAATPQPVPEQGDVS